VRLHLPVAALYRRREVTQLGTTPPEVPGTATIGALLELERGEEPALCAPGRPPLSYRGLRDHVRRTVAALNGRGVGRGDRVAIVLPNGPELASAFLATAAGACAAPLNPAYLEADFRFYLSDLGAKALIVERGSKSPAVAVARELGIPVLQIEWQAHEPAGTFSIAGAPTTAITADGYAEVEDAGLALHTSGTTSRPKLVPLLQRNLMTSAGHIARTLRLTPRDRCCNVMPLFHIHGLMAGVLSSIAAGASVFCLPEFSVSYFFAWLAEAEATWYTAVPTIHQSIVAHAEQHRASLDSVQLRFIRSSSAPLSPALLRNLEQVLRAPVIESYGMTEAAHQMASNPLPPGVRKPGTVGLAAGPEIAIMGGGGELQPAGRRGEVVIRGPNVLRGYENNPEANAAAFVDGWFRTGDEGVLDDEGYLTITGRLNEIINRGGEKIAPREIDDAIVDHPGVAAAATFPVAHPTLGEELAAAIVLKPGAALTEQALLTHLRKRLADFKIPRHLAFVERIPKGPTGKVQRRELARLLGLADAAGSGRAARRDPDRPATPLEARLQVVWQQTLEREHVGLHENFFMLGGDSLQGVELLTAIDQALGHSLPQSALVVAGTVAQMAELIERGAHSDCLVPIRTTGTRPPFFCVHDLSGHVLNLRNLALHLPDDQPFYAIQSVGLDGNEPPLSTIEEMAARYLGEIRGVQPVGPYYLGGYSMGGIVAHEMARQLREAGEGVALLALLDTYSGQGRQRVLWPWLRYQWREFWSLPVSGWRSYLAQRGRNMAARVLAIVRRVRVGDAGGGPGAP
jgi:oxalate---CoA ligase